MPLVSSSLTSLQLGQDRRSTGVSRVSLPSSTSRMTTVAVHTFEIDPIWKIESSVTGAPVLMFLFSVPVGGRHQLVGAAGREAQDAELSAGHLVALRQGGEPALPVGGLDRLRGAPPRRPRRSARPTRRRACRSRCGGSACRAAGRCGCRRGRAPCASERRARAARSATARPGRPGSARRPRRAARASACCTLSTLRVRRHRGEALAVGLAPRHGAELDRVDEVGVVARAADAGEVRDDAARDGGGEAVVVAGEVARHEAAVAVPGEGEALRVGEALGARAGRSARGSPARRPCPMRRRRRCRSRRRSRRCRAG